MTRHKRGWDAYAQHHRRQPAHPFVARALKMLRPSDALPRTAIDLGCGPGGNVLELLRAGFEVQAVDTNRRALRIVRERVAIQRVRLKKVGITQRRCVTICKAMSAFKAPHPAGVVLAIRSLGFESVGGFASLLKTLPQAVAPNGLLVVHFFGPHDDWRKSDSVRGLDAGEIKRWLRGSFELLKIEQRRLNRKPVIGPKKHWHEIFVVARRRGK